MALITVIIVGTLGGIGWFLFSESSRKKRVDARLRLAGGLTEDAFVVAQPNVADFVARAVYRYFEQLGHGVGVDPESDLAGTYEFDGDLLEECLDQLQSTLGIHESGFAKARANQKSTIRSIGDLVRFVDIAVRYS